MGKLTNVCLIAAELTYFQKVFKWINIKTCLVKCI